MRKAFIIVISGFPASGKSTLAKQLRNRLRWPLFAKDDYKEALFDTLGVRDAAWSRELSRAAYAVLFRGARELAEMAKCFIVEGNFRWHEWRDEFAALASHEAVLLQVHCRAQPEELVQRFRVRIGVRHVGHADRENLSSIEQELHTGAQLPLPLNAELFDCDTTGDWAAAIDRCVEEVVATVERLKSA